MANPFRKQRREPEAEPEDERQPDRWRPGEYAPYVPASARSPELQRFAVYPTEVDEDGQDEDIEFLTSLLNQVEQREPARRQPAPPTPRRAAARAAAAPAAPDQLQVFRDLAPEPERARVAEVIQVADVDMGDLLEALNTVAAALRRRRAA